MFEHLQTFAARLPTAGSLALNEVPHEHHHVHIVANCLSGGFWPVLEVYYDNMIPGEVVLGHHRADLWAPRPSVTDFQLFMEAKLARIVGADSTMVGNKTLQEAAIDWAWDIYRLLVGPAEATNCGFLLAAYSAAGQTLFQGVPTGGNGQTVLAAGQVDADQIYARVSALGGRQSSLDAVCELANIVLTDLHGKVAHLGGPVQFGNLWADPLLFEWRQAGPATAA